MPSPALITAYREPSGPGVRVDSGVRAGSVIAEIYDPMVAKLIVWDVDRESARRRMIRALDEYVVEGPATLIPFHRWLLENEEFIAGGACHALLAGLAETATPIPVAGAGVIAPSAADEAAEQAPQAERRFLAEVGGRRFEVSLRYDAAAGGGGGGPAVPARAPKAKRSAGKGGGGAPGQVVTPMQGTVLKVLVEVGQEVSPGDVVCIVEAMKMENEIAAQEAGIVKELRVSEGQGVGVGELLAVIG